MKHLLLRACVSLAALATLVVAAGDAPSVTHPFHAPAAAAAGAEAFCYGNGAMTPDNKPCLDIQQPAPTPLPFTLKLLAGAPSHHTTTGAPLLADADPTDGLVGYCIRVANEGHTALGGTNGFTIQPVSGGGPNATILSTAFFNNGSSTTTDDVFCAVIQPTPSSNNSRPPVVLTWTYGDGGAAVRVDLTLTVVTVRLIGTDGVVGGSAQVCTEGWDPVFLAGKAANSPRKLPFPSDAVAAADWRVVSLNATVLGVFHKPGSVEQCVTLSAAAPVPNISVALDFYAAYDPATTVDDYLATVQADNVVAILAAAAAELRHVIGDIDPATLQLRPDRAQILSDRVAPPNVIGIPHTACIIPSVAQDTLLAPGIHFNSPDGAIGTILGIFHDGTGGAPDLQGVINGTLCFTWTSSARGSQTVSVTFTASTSNPLNTSGAPKELSAAWDTNGDGNDFGPGQAGGQLFKAWDSIVRTVITTGGDITQGVVTNSAVSMPVDFIVAGGSFAGSTSLTEWVLGTRPPIPGQSPPLEPIDGVPVTLTLSGGCGYFVVESVNIVSSSAGSPTVITTALPHGLVTGDRVAIRDHVGSTPPINGFFTVTVLSSTTFSIPVAVATGGTGGTVTPLPRSIVRVTRDGRVAFTVKTDGDGGCSPGSVIRVRLTAAYPNGVAAPPVEVETVDIVVQYTPRTTTSPTVLWVGQTGTVSYIFSGGCQGAVATFTKRRGQGGAFVPRAPNTVITGETAVMGITSASSCQATIGIEDEDQGEVDVVAQLDCQPPACNLGVDPQRIAIFSKVVFPFYFLEFEDLAITAPAELTVSEAGGLDAVVRGWFVGTNPSPREAERKPDGRRLPQGRWVLPDDWQTLKGPQDFRGQWNSVPDLPPAKVTFYMENESVVNDFKAGVKNGAIGFFLRDEAPIEVDINIDPVSGDPSVLGSLQKPRVISEFTDLDGAANIDIFGDFNLSFEGCAVNAPTGNPYCKPGDVAGRTRYYAAVDYPELRGKHMPIRSNTVDTAFTWAGYKQLNVVDGPSPDVRYVVAHIKDRDGFCDSVSWNNVLGIPIEFTVDSGEGVITEVQGPPSSVTLSRRSGIATTYDTLDETGAEINKDIAKPVVESDECQAWIKITNSLMSQVNVVVRFPAQPVAIPPGVRISGLVCGLGGWVDVTNGSTRQVNLAGFGVKSLNNHVGVDPEEHLDLRGLLEPGQTVRFYSDILTEPTWIFTTDPYTLGNVTNDYARLVWNETEISRRTCAGVQTETANPKQDRDGEGDILLDIVVSFGRQSLMVLNPGWNFVAGPGAPTTLEQAFGDRVDAVDAIYAWDPAAGDWTRYLAGGGGVLERFEPGRVYWVEVNRAVTLALLR